MAFDLMVKDEDILAGFASLHQAMTEGFDRLERRFETAIIETRNEVARLGGIDSRLGRYDTRFTLLEERNA